MNLKNVYLHYNELYFGDELPNIPVIYKKLPETTAARTEFTKFFTPVRIAIDKRLKNERLQKYVLTSLLHEMIHVMLRGSFCGSQEFIREIRRLANEGAFDDLI
jgi:hypothetical protein